MKFWVPIKCETKPKRNETEPIETKPIETKPSRNQPKRNETNQNETKQIKMALNKTNSHINDRFI
jgi:hypothetical protein